MTTKEAVCKKTILSIFFLLVLCRTAGAQDARKAILSAADAGTCTANSTACSFLAVPSGSGGVTFTITTNASANTVQFEATGDTEPTGSHTWVALSVFPSNSTTSVTSTTSTGTWQANVAGFTQVRLRMSTFVGGTTTTYINLSTASARSGGGAGLPSGCTSPGAGAITCTGTVTADIGSFNSVGENFTDIACGAQSVGNSNQDRLSCDGTNWPVVSMNTNAAQKLALSMGVTATSAVNFAPTQADCGTLKPMNGANLTYTLPASIINSGCAFDVKNLAATCLTIARNGVNVDGLAANPTCLSQNQSYHITNDGAGYWTEPLFPASSSLALSSLTAAAASNTIASGNNPQTWNWAQTTDSQDGLAFGETSAATNGTLTNGLPNQANVAFSTAVNSTASPVEIAQGQITNTVATPALPVECSWNNAGLTGICELTNVTDTASAAASLILDKRVGNASKLSLTKAGFVSVPSTGQFCAETVTTLTDCATIVNSDGIYMSNGGRDLVFYSSRPNVGSIDGNISRVGAGLIGVGTGGAASVDGTMKGAAFLSASTTHALTMPVTIGSGTSIGSTQLCAAADCPAGLYAVSTYIVLTTACGTTGTYVANLIYTDDQGAKTVPVNINGTGAVPATGVLTTTSTANFGENVQVIQVASGNINYSTTAVACGTAGPMVGKLYMVADRRL